LQTVKPVGWSYARYEGTPRTGARMSLRLLAEFRDAITRDELVLFYQPQFELPGGACERRRFFAGSTRGVVSSRRRASSRWLSAPV
jgi:hypothetical protein